MPRKCVVFTPSRFGEKRLQEALNALQVRKDGKLLGVCNYHEIQKAKEAYLEAKWNAKLIFWAAKSSVSEESSKEVASVV